MNKYISILILLIWMLAACAPKPTEQSLLPNDDSYPNDSYPNQSYPNEDNSSPQLPSSMPPSIAAAITALSGTLNLPPGQITVVSTESVEWRDGCLGVQKIGVYPASMAGCMEQRKARVWIPQPKSIAWNATG